MLFPHTQILIDCQSWPTCQTTMNQYAETEGVARHSFLACRYRLKSAQHAEFVVMDSNCAQDEIVSVP